MQVGTRVRCKATGAGYTVLAVPNGPDVLVQSDVAGGVYFVAVDSIERVDPCKCGGTGLLWPGYEVGSGDAVPDMVPCLVCRREAKL